MFEVLEAILQIRFCVVFYVERFEHPASIGIRLTTRLWYMLDRPQSQPHPILYTLLISSLSLCLSLSPVSNQDIVSTTAGSQ